ncbi:MAG: proton-conducting transporter membrane subunit, partial [Bacteroidota bacterium]
PAAQDLRLMGGLYDQMPRLAWLYLPMMLALAGLPLFSGFLSKEGILEGAMQYGSHYEGVAWMVPVMALFSAGLTAFYMARHALLIFAGKPRFQTQVSLSPLPRTMLLPLAILSLGSIWLIWSLNPFSATQSPWLQFWPTPAFMLPQGVVSFEAAPYSQPGILLGLSLLLALGGMALGYFWWKRKEAQLRELPAQPHWAYQHFFQDFLYEMGVGKGSLRFSQLLGWIDKYVVDGLVRTLSWLTVHEHRNFASLSLLSAKWDERVFDGLVRWIAGTLGRVGRMFMRLQNGEIQAYWAMALFGILGLTGWMFWMIMN